MNTPTQPSPPVASPNLSRFFVDHPHVAWVLLIATCVWGIVAYRTMPQRKDPEIKVKKAVAITPWFGATAQQVEQQVTAKIEETIEKNASITKIESVSQDGLSIIYCTVDSNVANTKAELDDIALNLQATHDLPAGAGPIDFIRDFGDTAALMLTVTSPKVSRVEIALRAREVERAIRQARAHHGAAPGGHPVSMVVCLPTTVTTDILHAVSEKYVGAMAAQGLITQARRFQGVGFIGIDGISPYDDRHLIAATDTFIHEKLQVDEIPPDAWQPALIRDPSSTVTALEAIAGDKYSYRQMDDFTNFLQRSLKTVPQVSKVTRSGILGEQIDLAYSQERLAAYGLQPARLPAILGARNITLQGESLEAGGKSITIDPSGRFRDTHDLGNVLVPIPNGAPLYLRDLLDIERHYANPRYLNFYSAKDAAGHWQRARAITLAIQMRSGEQIDQFGRAVDDKLNEIRAHLPDDLLLARTSDQPKQVTENVNLFMRSLYEAVALVVLVSLIGFWNWRLATLMALSIPITLFMTFGLMRVFNIDLQQVSIATLIVALGLLVDVPVVAGDAINRELANGQPITAAAWRGVTKLRKAMCYATLTNIIAYLPFLILSGDIGRFLYSLPIVIACSLVAALIVSATFIPFLARYLLNRDAISAKPAQTFFDFPAFYTRLIHRLIDQRWRVFAGALVVLILGGACFTQLKQQFFPKDLSYLAYVDLWLPEDATFSATNTAAANAEGIIERTVAAFARERHRTDGVLKSLTTFVGGGGPRFWFSVEPVLQQLNYAQIIIEVNDRQDTRQIVDRLQDALSAQLPGIQADVKQLETGKPIGTPVALEISGDNEATLRRLAEEAKTILRATPLARRIRDNWGLPVFAVKLQTDTDRANSSGITNLDVAAASTLGMQGYPVTTLQEDDKQIPVVARLRMDERAQLADIENLYVYALQGTIKVPLRQVSTLQYAFQTRKLRRLNQFRTITVACFPSSGRLPSEVMNAIRPQLSAFVQHLPVGYHLHIAGEQAEQESGFAELVLVLLVSAGMIYLSLVFQFKHAVKPLIVFTAIPFGIVGALVVLWLVHAPFGFMAFLGVVSLVGVIVSHIIVLFDFIEEAHETGKPFREAIIQAGILRLRPVTITVAATVIALFPLATHGGPLWEPMCYAQIGGLTIATFITLLLVPVIYAICVLDLKLVRW